MKDAKLKYIKPELIVYSLDNEISLQMTSEGSTPVLPRSGSSSATSTSTATSPNPFDENSFKEQ